MSCMVDSWGDAPVFPEPVKIVSWDLDSWEDDLPEVSPKEEILAKEEPKIEQPQYVVRNRYGNYPYFVLSLKTTVLRTMYPKSLFPLGDLQRDLASLRDKTLLEYVLCIRNVYLSSIYNVLKSTYFYNPITRTRVPRKKNERADTGFSWVSLEDQRRVYQLFGFSGSNITVDDVFRLEILDMLKNLLYQQNILVDLVMYLFDSQNIPLDLGDVQRICQTLPQRADYAYKSYKLPEKWFYNSSWKKLSNASCLHIIGGGEGGRGAVEDAELELKAKL